MSVAPTTRTQTGISLRQIFPDAQFLNTVAGNDIEVLSCTDHVNECQSNDLFVAILDDEVDGHEHASLAIRRGATAVICERLLPVNVPQCIVPDSREAFGKICQALAGQPCQRMTTVAVAGTDGKTVTSHLIASIMKQAGLKVAVSSTLDPKITGGKSAAKPKHRTAECDTDSRVSPPQLAESLARIVMDGNQAAVVELDSPSLARRRFAGTEFDVAVLTNIRGNHFSFHHNLKNYKRAQLRVLDFLKSHGSVVLNADDRTTQLLLEEIEKPFLTVGIKQQADVKAEILESDLSETTFTIEAGDETVMVRTKIPGQHHVHNCLCAAAAALLQGIDLVTIARGLQAVDQLPGRMNMIRCGQDFPIAVDLASSPYRLGVALHTLKQHTKGRVFCVFNSPEAADSVTASQFGRIAERSCAVPVITRPTTKGNQQVGEHTDFEPIHQVLDGFEKPSTAQIMPDRIAAIEWALSQAGPEDAILIAGRGAESIASLSNGKWKLTDAEVCQSWLYGESAPGQGIPAMIEPPAIFNIDNYRRC